ncbi:MAG: septum formation initiator family protein [Bacteroidota bacterium]|nr:septum formation initiator family protein [Bacteroidota bacterium]
MKKTFTILKNKYLISTLILLTILFVFEETSVFRLIKMNLHVNDLIQENYNREIEIQKVKEKTIQLTTNRDALEKFARETYFMKKKDEVVYVFTD